MSKLKSGADLVGAVQDPVTFPEFGVTKETEEYFWFTDEPADRTTAGGTAGLARLMEVAKKTPGHSGMAHAASKRANEPETLHFVILALDQISEESLRSLLAGFVKPSLLESLFTGSSDDLRQKAVRVAEQLFQSKPEQFSVLVDLLKDHLSKSLRNEIS